MKIRANFYIDADRLEALKRVAESEETSLSDLVREGIDRVITERMNGKQFERTKLRANLVSFLERYGGAEPAHSIQEIEDLVSKTERRK